MKDINFRRLRADEVEARVQSTKNGKTRLLLYIDSRAVVNLLNETVGAMNWETEFAEVNGQTICRMGIWDEGKSMFVFKSDTGSESNIEAKKGLISDAYKRCLARWGVTELYTTPEIVVNENPYAKYKVTRLEYIGESRNISGLTIVDNNNNVVFNWSYDKGATVSGGSFKLHNNTESKPATEQKTAVETEAELQAFCNQMYKKTPEELKPTIKDFCKNFGEKTATQLPIKSPKGLFIKWLKTDRTEEIRDNIETLLKAYNG